MIGAIDAFRQGDIYGTHQARIIKQIENQRVCSSKASVKLPSFESHKDEFEFYRNPVVCRAINETRKIINAIIEKYGSPYAINIEVASELNRTFEERKEIENNQKINQKKRENVKAEVAKELGISVSEVTARQVECYILGEQQGWKCLYSGIEINKKDCLDRNNRTYEIDHIIPYSIILDNTLHNKALVCTNENQNKRQRTPLMYLTGEAAEEFKGRVRAMYFSKSGGASTKSDGISKRKYEYLMTESLSSELIAEWKTRNINDTRYISKFLVRYLKENLIFNHDNDQSYRQSEVYAVKGALTSQMRRLWLNEKTWGKTDKTELKSVTLLDHAIDAVVIACCIPAYVEIASVQNKLSRIYKRAHKQETEEYGNILDNCVDAMKTYYGMNPDEVRRLLRKRDRTPCLIENLRNEVDVRFIEPYTFRMLAETEDQRNMTDDEIYALYRAKCRELYPDDIEFADSLQPIIVSHKPIRKLSGSITKENALSVRVIDGVEWELSRVPILNLKKKQLANVYSGDEEMLDMLNELMSQMKDDDTVNNALSERGEDCFITPSGRRINKITLKSKPQGRKLIKNLPDGGATVLDSTSYYCIELYKNQNGELKMRGITCGELVRAGGKLWLSEQSYLPEDYAEHCMYLRKWDYIKVIDRKGKLKFQGYFVSTYNINQGMLYYALNTTATLPKKALSISRKDKIYKYEVDILGKMGGEVKCGEPLLSITERS